MLRNLLLMSAAFVVCGLFAAERVPLLDFSRAEDAKGAFVNTFGKKGRHAFRHDADRGCMVYSFTNLYAHVVFPELNRRLKACAAKEDPHVFYVKYRAPEYAASTEFKSEGRRPDGTNTIQAGIMPIAPGPDFGLSVIYMDLAWNRGGTFVAANASTSYVAPNGNGTLEIYEIGVLRQPQRPKVVPRDPTPLAPDAFTVFPEPRQFTLTGGELKLPKRCSWTAADLPAQARADFERELKDFHGIGLRSCAEGETPLISFALAKELGPVKYDGFAITVDAAAIRVQALEPAGLAYGALALAELIWRAGGERVPAFILRDWPRFAIRPWMDSVTSCGHEQRYMPSFYNEMVRKFAIGARYNRFGHWMDNLYQWRHPGMLQQNNAWTREDLCAVVDYVNGYGLRMMPTLECLGHQTYFIGYRKGNAEKYCEGGHRDVLCTRNPETTKLLFDLADEVYSVHARDPKLRPDYFLTMHDEVRWRDDGGTNACPRCAGVPRNELFLESVLRCRDYAAKKGMKAVMFTDMVSEPHNGRNRFNCAAIRDRIPKDVVLASWSALDDMEIDSFAKAGYENWKLYTGFHANVEGEGNVAAEGLGIYAFNWWLSRVRGGPIASYGILAAALQANFAWREPPTGETEEDLHLARKYGDFLMRGWSRKPLHGRKGREEAIPVDLSVAPGRTVSLVFTHSVALDESRAADFFDRRRVHDALKGPVVAVFTATYVDGTAERIPMNFGWNVAAAASDGRKRADLFARYLADCRRVIPNAFDTEVRYEYEWANPHPEKKIVSLTLEMLPSPGATYRLHALAVGRPREIDTSGPLLTWEPSCEYNMPKI